MTSTSNPLSSFPRCNSGLSPPWLPCPLSCPFSLSLPTTANKLSRFIHFATSKQQRHAPKHPDLLKTSKDAPQFPPSPFPPCLRQQPKWAILSLKKQNYKCTKVFRLLKLQDSNTTSILCVLRNQLINLLMIKLQLRRKRAPPHQNQTHEIRNRKKLFFMGLFLTTRGHNYESERPA